jgi:flagellar motor switch protein FliN/FliY
MAEVLDQAEIDALLSAAAEGGISESAVEESPLKDAQIAEELHVVAPGSKDKYKNLEILRRLPIKISVRVGQAQMLIRDFLALGNGSTLYLEQFVKDPVEILVNGRVVALGEMVAVGQCFGVRICKVMNARERLEALS